MFADNFLSSPSSHKHESAFVGNVAVGRVDNSKIGFRLSPAPAPRVYIAGECQ